MRTWIRLIPAVLLVLPFLSPSLRAGDAETNAQRIEKLEKEVGRLHKEIEDLRKSTSQEELAKIRELLELMAVKQGVIAQRQAGYNPSSVGGAAPPVASPSTGTITVENQFPGDAQVRINGQMYTVPAFRTIQVHRVATGSFEYSVEMNGNFIQPPRFETLQPTGYIIRIYRRP
jgi:hypothetical protein